MQRRKVEKYLVLAASALQAQPLSSLEGGYQISWSLVSLTSLSSPSPPVVHLGWFLPIVLPLLD